MYVRNVALFWGILALLAGQLNGQVVQLPTLRVFGVQTTVSVPDQGSVSLGGVSRAGNWATSRGFTGLGPFGRTRSSASSLGTSQVHLGVTVIDHRQWDEMILGQDGKSSTHSGFDRETEKQANLITRHVARSSASVAPFQSIEQIRSQNLAIQRERHQEALSLARRADQALTKGQKGAARVYLQMAAKRADDKLRKAVLAKLDSLDRR